MKFFLNRLFDILIPIINLVAKILLRFAGALGGLIVGILLIIYSQVFDLPLHITWYWVLLGSILAGVIFPRYFFFFTPFIFDVFSYESYGGTPLTREEQIIRQKSCAGGLVAVIYALACIIVLFGCISWFFSESGPPLFIFRLTLTAHLFYLVLVSIFAREFKSQIIP